MRTIKVISLTADNTEKPVIVKNVKEVSIVNGVLELFTEGKDDKNYTRSSLSVGFALGRWLYFIED